MKRRWTRTRAAAIPKKDRTKLKRFLAALLTALMLLSACPALTPAPAEAKTAKAKRAKVKKSAKKSSKSSKSSRSSKKAKKSKNSSKSKKSQRRVGRGIGVYIVRPQLAARHNKVSAARRQTDGEAPMTDSRVVKVITTSRSEQHVMYFEIPVWIVPARGYTLEKVARGCCADAKKKISLEASELQVPYAKLLAEFSPQKLQSAGVSLKSRARFVWNGADAALLKVFQKNGRTVVGKWLLLLDRGEKSWMISGLFQPQDEDRSLAVLDMLKSVCWDTEEQNEEHLNAMLPRGYVKTDGTPFKLAGIRQDAFVYTKDAEVPTRSPDGSLFVVSRLPESRFTDEDRLAFAKKNLEEVESGKPLELVSQNEFTAGGLAGLELTAYTADGHKKLVYEAMLFDAAETCVMVGIARGDTIDALEQFHHLAASYAKSPLAR